MKPRHLFILSFTSLFSGGAIYLLFRSVQLRMFSWTAQSVFFPQLLQLRKYTALVAKSAPDWMLYALPDGLWLFAYTGFILALWKNEINSQSRFWLFAVPVIAVISEIGQVAGIVPGTFDFADLLAYIAGASLPLLLQRKLITFNTYQL